MTRPLILLGVRRSGTTLLRVILDRSSGITIPDESYFIPQLAHRHRGTIDPERFLDDLRRLPTLVEWGLTSGDISARLRPGMSTGDAIAAVFEAYAAERGKTRWGDKTPLYMQHLGLLERLYPNAQYVHLIRDGRDAAVSFVRMPEGIVTQSWAHPMSAADFACQWKTEVSAAQALGHRVGSAQYAEVRYERLVEDPQGAVQEICSFAALPFEPRMLDYAGDVDVASRPHQQRLRQGPTHGVRNWRVEMSRTDALAFEAVAGDLLVKLGYGLLDPASERIGVRARLRLGWYRARIGAWNAGGFAIQRSSLWRRRHPRLS